MVGIQIGKEQEERKREEEGLNFETTPWWNFITIMGYADEELRSASLLKLRAQPTAKAKAIIQWYIPVLALLRSTTRRPRSTVDKPEYSRLKKAGWHTLR